MELVISDDLIMFRYGDGFVVERRFRVGYYIFEVSMFFFNINRFEIVIMMDVFVSYVYFVMFYMFYLLF